MRRLCPLVEAALDEYKEWAKEVAAAEEALKSLKIAAENPEQAAAKASAAEIPTYMHGVKIVKTLEIGEYPKARGSSLLDSFVFFPLST